MLKHSVSLGVLLQKITSLYSEKLDQDGNAILPDESQKEITFDQLIYLNSRSSEVNRHTDIDEEFSNLHNFLSQFLQNFTENGSKFLVLDFPLVKYQIILTSSLDNYGKYFTLLSTFGINIHII